MSIPIILNFETKPVIYVDSADISTAIFLLCVLISAVNNIKNVITIIKNLGMTNIVSLYKFVFSPTSLITRFISFLKESEVFYILLGITTILVSGLLCLYVYHSMLLQISFILKINIFIIYLFYIILVAGFIFAPGILKIICFTIIPSSFLILLEFGIFITITGCIYFIALMIFLSQDKCTYGTIVIKFCYLLSFLMNYGFVFLLVNYFSNKIILLISPELTIFSFYIGSLCAMIFVIWVGKFLDPSDVDKLSTIMDEEHKEIIKSRPSTLLPSDFMFPVRTTFFIFYLFIIIINQIISLDIKINAPQVVLNFIKCNEYSIILYIAYDRIDKVWNSERKNWREFLQKNSLD